MLVYLHFATCVSYVDIMYIHVDAIFLENKLISQNRIYENQSVAKEGNCDIECDIEWTYL